MAPEQLMGTIERVVSFTTAIDRERDCWERAPAVAGVLAWGDDRDVAVVRGWIDRAIATQTSEGNLSHAERLELPAGHVRTFTPTASLPASLGHLASTFYERTGDTVYLEAARRQLDALLAVPRTRHGGFWARKEGPELWIDFVYMMCPFLAHHGVVSDDGSLVDEAFHQLEVHVSRLVDPATHLARHAWLETPNSFPQSTLWARGNGWLVTAIVDLLALAPHHREAKEAAQLLDQVLRAMVELQDRSGYLRHVLDDPAAPFEASSTVMLSYAVGRAIELGLPGEEYLEGALRAFRVVAGAVDGRGAVQGVAVPPGGPGVPFGVTPFGQGFFLLAADVLRRPLGLPARA